MSKIAMGNSKIAMGFISIYMYFSGGGDGTRFTKTRGNTSLHLKAPIPYPRLRWNGMGWWVGWVVWVGSGNKSIKEEEARERGMAWHAMVPPCLLGGGLCLRGAHMPCPALSQ